MEQQFRDYIASMDLISKDDSVLLALSGGVDSLVMAALFQSSGIKSAVAHANFQLRGSDSLKDEARVQGLSESWGIPFHCKRFETKKYKGERGVSTQMAARELRYQWFEELLEEFGYSKVATAHHRDDLVETVLLNLTKGTGIRGLHGIKPQWGHIIRPMLFATKEEILDYATAHNMVWSEDQSNYHQDYQRNLIRHQVVPALRKINPQLEASITQTVEIIGAIESIFEDYLAGLRKRMITCKGAHVYITINSLAALEGPIFYELIKEYGFNYPQCRDILSSLGGQSGKLFNSQDYQLNMDRTHLIISPRQKQATAVLEIREARSNTWSHEGVAWSLKSVPAGSYRISDDPGVGAWDKDKLQFPLRVRKWQPGDWFHPLGMDHKKKISDFMVDKKIPRNFKERMQVVLSGDDIIWLAGQRIDNRYKVTPETRMVLEISLRPQS